MFDCFEVPDDPMGRHGPSLDAILSRDKSPSSTFMPRNNYPFKTNKNVFNYRKNNNNHTSNVKKTYGEGNLDDASLGAKLSEMFPFNWYDIRGLLWEYPDEKNIYFFIDKLIRE